MLYIKTGRCFLVTSKYLTKFPRDFTGKWCGRLEDISHESRFASFLEHKPIKQSVIMTSTSCFKPYNNLLETVNSRGLGWLHISSEEGQHLTTCLV